MKLLSHIDEWGLYIIAACALVVAVVMIVVGMSGMSISHITDRDFITTQMAGVQREVQLLQTQVSSCNGR